MCSQTLDHSNQSARGYGLRRSSAIGQTPVSDNFTYYGTRHIEIVKDGYRTETFLRTFNPPWYQIPPLDFVTENLWPWEKRDERIVDVQMVPEPVVPQEALIASAENLRLQASQGIAVVSQLTARSERDRLPESKSQSTIHRSDATWKPTARHDCARGDPDATEPSGFCPAATQ